jgi:hypothetical protein
MSCAEETKTHRILVRRNVINRKLGISTTWEDNIKIDLREVASFSDGWNWLRFMSIDGLW